MCRFALSSCHFCGILDRANKTWFHKNGTKQYGTTEIVTKKFRCELCNSEMKFCRQNIYAHMKDVHKITLQDYEAQIGMYAIDIFSNACLPRID